MRDFRYKLIPLFADAITPDAEMAAAIAKARAPFAAELAREVGRTETLLYRRGNFAGTFDDLICAAHPGGARRRDRALAGLPLGDERAAGRADHGGGHP